LLRQFSLIGDCDQPDGIYRVIYADFRLKTVGAEELIGLQSQMLQKKGR